MDIDQEHDAMLNRIDKLNLEAEKLLAIYGENLKVMKHNKKVDLVDTSILEKVFKSVIPQRELVESLLTLRNKDTRGPIENIINTSEKTLLLYADLISRNDDNFIYTDLLKIQFNDKATKPITIKPGSTIIPEIIILPRDKVTNKILNNEIPYTGKGQQIAMEKIGGSPITTTVSLEYSQTLAIGNIKMTPTHKITRYDMEVLSAVANLHLESENEGLISYTTLYRTITSNKKAKLTKNSKAELEESLFKLSSTKILIDCKEEIKNYPTLENFKLPKWRNMLLIETDIEVDYNGNVVDDWIKIIQVPFLFDYAYRKGHVSQIPIKQLNTDINKNKENIMLQAYLRDRIIRMNGTQLSKNIAFNAIYNLLDLKVYNPEIHSTKNSFNQKKSKIRDYTFRILKGFKENGFIKNYSPNENNFNAKKDKSITISI